MTRRFLQSEGNVGSEISAEDVFICLDRLWTRLADSRSINHLEIHMEDGTRLFDEMRVFDAAPSGDFGLEREVHYFNTIGRVVEYRADILTEGGLLAVSVSFIGRKGPLFGFHLDPAVLSREETAQLQAIMARLAEFDWAPGESQADCVLRPAVTAVVN